MRRERFDAVTCHSPVAGAVGRIAARLAGVPRVIYTVHGFYFHEETPAPLRRLLVAAEWLLGRLTTHFAFVSEEDRQTALRTGIAASERQTTTIHDGIDLARFSGASSAGDEAAFERALQARARGCAVVGIVARLVREKGYQEFLAMARRVAGAGREVVFLVIGRSLPTDRDRFEETFKREIREAGLEDRFILAGFTSKVPAYLGLMDVFVLPSYREGLPRSILEAMGAGLPVVATDIRGCREEVVHGETGLIVPPRNAEAVSEAVLFLLDHPDQAAEMGRAGRRRAAELYDQRQVCRRFVKIFRGLFHAGRLAAGSPVRLAPEEKHVA
jgi:glycosyltransferase involved in cell wall biosynthesis